MKNKIKEIIVCEGRDDTAAIRRAVDAETIETHGFGMSPAMWEQIEKAACTSGIIVFTDPDHAGGLIRRKIKERFPDAKEAFLPREEARKKDNIGVENASPEAIREALSKARCTLADGGETFSQEDLVSAGLVGGAGAKATREALCGRLGIGYCNGKSLLARLNGFGITREEFYEALRPTDHTGHQE